MINRKKQVWRLHKSEINCKWTKKEVILHSSLTSSDDSGPRQSFGGGRLIAIVVWVLSIPMRDSILGDIEFGPCNFRVSDLVVLVYGSVCLWVVFWVC